MTIRAASPSEPSLRTSLSKPRSSRSKRPANPDDVLVEVKRGRASGEVGRARSTEVDAAANSTEAEKGVDSRALVSSSRKASELTIEALYLSRLQEGARPAPHRDDAIPDECERARLIGDLTRLLREPLMPETTRCAGLTLIGWLARRMPGEAAHAIGVSEARQSERRLRAAQRKPR